MNQGKNKIIGLWLVVITVFISLVFIEIHIYDRRSSIKRKLKITTAIVTGSHISRGEGRILNYKYTINNAEFVWRKKSIFYNSKDLLYKKFPLVYDSTNPLLNEILLDSSDYRYFKLQFPDSMKWTLKHIKND